MKRDLDLCRGILLEVEAGKAVLQQHVSVAGFSNQQVMYHLLLLVDAGLMTQQDGCFRLTWSGHEFLDSAREDGRWQRAKGVIEKAGGATFEVLKGVLVDLLKKHIGIS